MIGCGIALGSKPQSSNHPANMSKQPRLTNHNDAYQAGWMAAWRDLDLGEPCFDC